MRYVMQIVLILKSATQDMTNQTCGLGLNVVGSDGHPSVVNGSLPVEGHAPLVVLRHVGLAGRQGHGWIEQSTEYRIQLVQV